MPRLAGADAAWRRSLGNVSDALQDWVERYISSSALDAALSKSPRSPGKTRLAEVVAQWLRIMSDCFEAAARFGRLGGGHLILFDLEQLP